jgi:hypothetical protein
MEHVERGLWLPVLVVGDVMDKPENSRTRSLYHSLFLLYFSQYIFPVRRGRGVWNGSWVEA